MRVSSGGTTMDVIGSNLDSVANPRLDIYLNATSVIVGQDVMRVTVVYSEVS